jgi:RNA polymerase primary sigma factor
MSDIPLDPAIAKLLEYAKTKKSISYDELSDFLPESILNTDKIDTVLALLESNNIKLEEEELPVEEESPQAVRKEDDRDKKRLVYSEKDSAVDDPIRLYLREIGKENLLTAEQEVELSKLMEEGENIIKSIIKKSGMMVPEFYSLAQKAFSKKDPPGTQPPQEGPHGILGRAAAPQPILQGLPQGRPR